MIKIIEKQTIQIPSNLNLLSDVIGVDSGQTLTKTAYAEGGELHLSVVPTNDCLKIISDLIESKKDLVKSLNFTGGPAFQLYKEFSKQFPSEIINEFDANTKGIEALYFLEKDERLPPSIVVTIGTGTSMVLKREVFQHLGGSAMGGAFFMGLIKLIFNMEDFQEAIKLAKKGNRYNIDLKVADIYDIEDDRVDKTFRELTAASLGKIHKNFERKDLKKEDFLNSVLSLIAENLATIAYLMAENYTVENLIFCGGFMKNNRVFQRILKMICNYYGKKAIFLKNSEYTGVIGCLV